jgi:hypothetical protein
MGLVIRFPDVWRNAKTTTWPGEAATVIILPVVRIEREAKTVSEPRSARSPIRRRKRPASRS